MNVPLNIDWQQILLHLLNFVILYAILYFLLYSPVKKFMEKRTQYYENMENEANRNFQDAENSKQMYADKLNAADEEIEKKTQEAYKAISDKTAASALEAEKKAEEIIANAHRKAEIDRRRIMENAQKEIADMVTEATEKIVQANTSDSYEQFLSAVERGKENDEG